MGRTIARAVFCAAAALVAWILTEPFLPKDVGSENWQRQEFIMVCAVLGLIGLAAGAHQGINRGGVRNIALGAALGCVFALVGGLLGYQIGGQVANALFGAGWWASGMPVVTIPRTIALGFTGLLLGVGMGVPQFTWRALLSGGFGGLIGGGIAGVLFDPVGMLFGAAAMLQAPGAGGVVETGAVPRAVTWGLMGFAVGLFTALIDTATRQAWIRLVLGRNEGKEWPIDAAQTHIGRDERAHIPLFGDPNVAPLHATIVRDGPRYVLQDAGTPLGIGLNGVRVGPPVVLTPGDTIQVGALQLQFLMKGAAARRATEGRSGPYPVTPQTSLNQNQPAQPIQPIQAGALVTSPAPTQPQTQTYAQVQTQTFSLLATTGPLTGQRFPVAAPTEIGRETPGLPLGFDSQASRRHAIVQPTPHGLSVQDLGSTNGTFVNGQRVSQSPLVPGDTLTVGSTSFRVESP